MGSLSELQHDVVVGTLLGDGAMRCKTNALLEINHSADQQSYVEWKYRQLENLVCTPPKVRRGNGGRVACRFVTRSLPALTPLLPALLRSREEESSEDGALSPGPRGVVHGRRLSLAESGVSEHPAVRLAESAAVTCDAPEQWGIDTALNRDKSYHRIRVSVGGTTRLRELIEPYVLPELRYKLPA